MQNYWLLEALTSKTWFSITGRRRRIGEGVPKEKRSKREDKWRRRGNRDRTIRTRAGKMASGKAMARAMPSRATTTKTDEQAKPQVTPALLIAFC